jgi:hypothetical protein
MAQFAGIGGRLATAAIACGVLAFPLWLLSFSWVPFALTGRVMGSAWYIVLVGEVGALLAALLAIGLGSIARRRASAGTAYHRRASQGLTIGVIALVLIVGLNIVGLVFA